MLMTENIVVVVAVVVVFIFFVCKKMVNQKDITKKQSIKISSFVY